MLDTKYQIVLFNNKSKKRILNTSNVYININQKYKELVKKSTIIFPILYNNKKKCNFEIALVCVGKCKTKLIHKRDTMGRLAEVTTKNKKYRILDIVDYEIEEKVYDHKLKKRIYFTELFGLYLDTKTLTQIYSLNNKIIVQNNEQFYLFSLKNVSESLRFLNCTKKYFNKINKFNCLISRDLSTAHRKELYSLLESKGFSRKLLHKHYTY